MSPELGDFTEYEAEEGGGEGEREGEALPRARLSQLVLLNGSQFKNNHFTEM